MSSAQESLQRLIEGNQRFVAGRQEQSTAEMMEKRRELVEGQAPFAIILGCSDSRVPAELVFDQGLGDLFVIRVAGNVVAPSQIGSIEFAAEAFGTRLVVVMGHSNCGAIQATLDELQRPQENRSPNLRSIVDRIRPSIEPLVEAAPQSGDEDLVERAVRANIRASARQLRYGSQILEELVQSGELMIVGAEYSLETGEVDFFEGVDAG
ncbi:carbonic anhydrase [Microbulbifer sp. SAOS-129_SWC]|uniref:carbonic anhydrase n=1 Tax=Microbulbifer sp. SAOS-129_SWC TaxID=3145235 RepID=UPI0032176E9F